MIQNGLGCRARPIEASSSTPTTVAQAQTVADRILAWKARRASDSLIDHNLAAISLSRGIEIPAQEESGCNGEKYPDSWRSGQL
jgi:hypothetical protein